MISDLERARRRVVRHPQYADVVTRCILAHTCIQNNGYVKVKFMNRYVYLHRLVAFIHLGLDLDDTKSLVLHKRECPNRHCFNKDHLYIGNPSQNADDYVVLGKHHEHNKTHCDKGHIFDTVIRSRRDGIVRCCSICRRDAQTKFRNKT